MKSDSRCPRFAVLGFLVGLATAGLGAERAAAGKLRVVATTADLAAIARVVGGDQVEVTSIARGYQDPHDVQAKPSYTRLVNRADLLVYTGLQLEVGWLPLLLHGGRTPEVLPGAPGHLDASGGIERLELPAGEVDRTMGDIHPEGNPHYMLDPRNGPRVAAALSARLAALRPEQADSFRSHADRFREELSVRIAEWEQRSERFQGRNVVAYHKQWEYLLAWLGVEIIGYIENKPGIPPSPRHLTDLMRRMSAQDVQLILCANFVHPATAERVGKKTGARVLILPASPGGEPGIDSYADVFEAIVGALEGAFDGR